MLNSFDINLPASKSISNRILIIKDLYYSDLDIQNISTSNDTVIINNTLKNAASINDIHCEDSGAALRFLLSWAIVKSKFISISGHQRLSERPIQPLLDTLKALGAEFEFLEKVNAIPLKILKFKLKNNNLDINPSESSQFLSSLLLVLPYFKQDFLININAIIPSKPYFNMTMSMLNTMGIHWDQIDNTIKYKYIPFNFKQNGPYIIENDWSAASYWFGIASLKPNLILNLKGLNNNSLQGDAIIKKWAGSIGVNCKDIENGITIQASSIPIPNHTIWKLEQYPDLAPTLICILAAKKLNAQFFGLDTLEFKESNRIEALAYNLKLFGATFTKSDNFWQLDASKFEFKTTTIKTYNDHRIAMCFAMYQAFGKLEFDNYDCVKKSYPNFWDEIKKIL